MANNNVAQTKLGIPVVLPNFQYLGRDSTVATAGFGTLSAVTLDWYRNMTTLRCRGRFTTGTPTAVTASISLRDGNSNSYTNTTVVGKWWRNNSSATTRKSGTLFTTGGSSAVFFSNDDYTNSGDQGTPIVGNVVASATEILFVDFEVPVAGWDLTAYQAYGAGLATSAKPGLISPQTVQTSLTVTSSQAGFAVNRAVAIAYADNNNVWRLTFNISAAFTSASLATFSMAITGVTFAAANQSISNFMNGASGAYWRSFTGTSNSTITLDTPTAVTVAGVQVSGDIELASKPTWA